MAPFLRLFCWVESIDSSDWGKKGQEERGSVLLLLQSKDSFFIFPYISENKL